MFPVPTLQKLAAQKTVSNYLDLGWKISYPIDRESTDDIINEFPKDSKTDFIRQNYQNLKLDRLDFSRKENMKEDIEMLRSLVLDSLTLGDLSYIDGYCHKTWNCYKGDQFHVDIIAFLKNVLQEKSRQKLYHLNIGYGVEFTTNWLEQVLELVPNLKSLAIQNLRSSYLPDFFKLSKTFEFVSILDLSEITISSLEGISNFTNLKNLIFHSTEIEKTESMREISKLKKLVELDISRYPDEYSYPDTYIVKALVTFCDSLPELRAIDCSVTNIQNEELQKIQEISPKLEMIVLHLNEEYDASLLRDSVKCMDTLNLRSTIELYRYLDSKNRTAQVSRCLDKMKTLILSECGERGDCPILHEFLLFLCELFDGSEEEASYHLPDCFKCYSEHFKQFLDNQEKLKIASTLIKAIPRIPEGFYNKIAKGTCWFVIRDLNIISIPGAPDILSLLLVSIFEDHVATEATINLLRTQISRKEGSINFKDDENLAFWVTNSIRVLDSIEPQRMYNGWWTNNELPCYRVLIDMCNDFLNECRSEIDIEEVITLIGHLKELDGHEELLNLVTKAIRSMILLVDHRTLHRIPKNLIIDLFKNIIGDLLRSNEDARSFLENEEARSSIVILKSILSSLAKEDFEKIHEELHLELIKQEIPPIDSASGIVDEVVKQVRSVELPTQLDDGKTRNVNGKLIEENLLKDHSIKDILRSLERL